MAREQTATAIRKLPRGTLHGARPVSSVARRATSDRDARRGGARGAQGNRTWSGSVSDIQASGLCWRVRRRISRVGEATFEALMATGGEGKCDGSVCSRECWGVGLAGRCRGLGLRSWGVLSHDVLRDGELVNYRECNRTMYAQRRRMRLLD